MSIRCKRLCSWLLTLTVVLGLTSAAIVPTIATAADDGSVYLTKSATLTDNGTYTIDLSAFVTGKTVYSQVTTYKPLDVVLVLDASSSMLKFKNTPDTYVTTDKVVGWREETFPYPVTATSSTNLWAEATGMSRVSMFYSNQSGGFETTNTLTDVRGSVMIPVKPGDRIYCSSFRAKVTTGADQDGICVAFFRSNGKLLKSVSAANVYKEFTASGNKYITVPDGAYAMNVPVWKADSDKTIYNRSLGEERYNPVNKLEFEATRAKIMQQQVQAFTDALAANSKETGAEHKMAIVTFGGGGNSTAIGYQGRYEKHVGVNGYNNYLYTNSGLFVNGSFKNYYNKEATSVHPSYAAVFSADLDTSKTYYHFERTTSLDDINGFVRSVTYDKTTGKWINDAGKTVVPQSKPYGYNSRIQFYEMTEVEHTSIKESEYRAALTDVLVGGQINPDLQYAIDRYVARGTTHTELGLALADEILENNLPRQHTNKITGETETCEQVVILFTDGQTNDPDTNSAGVNTYQTIFYRGNRIKHKGAKIYTVGVADMEEEGAVVAPWMDQLSTNHPDVVLSSDNKPVTHGAAASIFNPSKALSGGKYFKSIEDISELNEIFTSITTDISTSTTSVELDDKAVMQDQLTGDFKLPDDFGFDNIKVTIVGMQASQSGSSIEYSEKTGASAVKEVVYDAVAGTTPNGDVVSSSYKYGTSIDLTVSYNRVTGMVSVTGFDYAKYFVAPDRNNGFKLKVQITGVEATNATPTDVLLDTNTNKSGIAYVDADGKSGLHPFEFPKTQLASKSYVMDYAKPLIIDSADWGVSNIIGFADMSRLKIAEANRNSFESNYGTFTKNADGTTFTFTPNNMNWDKPASFYVLHTLGAAPDGVTTGTNQWLKINVIPANNIYYEDDFNGITYDSEEDGGTWTTDGTGDQATIEHHEGDTSKVLDNDVENGIHGWESSLVDSQYTNGSAHKAVINAEATAEAVFSFSFIGTGVDIYGRTNSSTGTVLAMLDGMAADGSTPVSQIQIVDTESASGDYFQIPAVSFMGLPYGTYSVTVRLTTAAEGRFTYYVDGVRVYDPLMDDSAYTVAEREAEFSEVRDLLANTEGNEDIDENGKGNAVFIDKLDEGKIAQMKPYNETEYGMYGPKNEVYLASDQYITFKVDFNADAYYYVGLKCPIGTGSTVVSVSNGDGTRREITVGHSSDMYYSVTPDANGYITIENTGTGLLSITKLRIAGSDENAQVLTIMDEEAVNAAKLFAMRPVALEVENDIDFDTLVDIDAEATVDLQPSEKPNSDNSDVPDNSDLEISFWVWGLVLSMILLVCCVGGVYEKKVH